MKAVDLDIDGLVDAREDNAWLFQIAVDKVRAESKAAGNDFSDEVINMMALYWCNGFAFGRAAEIKFLKTKLT